MIVGGVGSAGVSMGGQSQFAAAPAAADYAIEPLMPRWYCLFLAMGCG
jgi:hypothetical protein